jgi:glycosyltransferase involved in cell wall biosynthesis
MSSATQIRTEETITSRSGLKIAIASSGLGHIARGIETWADDLACALHSAGEDVTLFQGAGEPVASYAVTVPAWKRFDSKTQRAVKFFRRLGGWRYGCGSGYELEQTTFSLHLWRRIRHAYDILHVQDPLVALILDRLQRAGLSRPRVILAHGTEESPEKLKKYSYLQHLAPNYDTDWQQHRPARQFSTAIPNFVDTDRFHPGNREECRAKWDLPRDAFVVLCVAALKKTHKRCDYVIREFERFIAEGRGDAILVMAGAREQESEEIISLGERLLGSRIRFLQSVPRCALPSLYQAADVYVIGSLHEMMPIALLEAMASGLPIIAHDTQTLRWMVEKAGVVADLRAPGALSAALDKVSNAARRYARSRAESVFSAETVVPEILRMYGDVIAWRPPAGTQNGRRPLHQLKAVPGPKVSARSGSLSADLSRSPNREHGTTAENATKGSRELQAEPTRTRRFCIVNPSFPRLGGVKRGGTDTYAELMAKCLIDGGFEVHIVVYGEMPGEGSPTSSVLIHRVALRWIPYLSYFLPNIFQAIQLCVAILRLDRKYNFDVIEASNDEGLSALLCLVFRKKLWLRLHSSLRQHVDAKRERLNLRKKFSIWLDGFAARRAPRLITHSHAHARAMSAEYGVSTRRIQVVEYGIDDPVEYASIPRTECRTIGYIGTLDHRKGIDLFLNAVSRIKTTSGLEFIVVGRDGGDSPNRTWREWFDEQCSDPDVRDRVRFLGAIDSEHLEHLWGALDAVVVPSRYESFGLVVIEAFSRCKAVIACASGALPEVCAGGALICPATVEGVAAGIDTVVRDRDRFRSLALAGRKAFTERYTSEGMRDKLLDVYFSD